MPIDKIQGSVTRKIIRQIVLLTYVVNDDSRYDDSLLT